MDKVDDLLRAAAEVTRAQAADAVDLDAELAAVLRRTGEDGVVDGSVATDRRLGVTLTAAAAAIIALVAAVAIVSQRDDTIRTAAPDVSRPTVVPVTTLRAPSPITTSVPDGTETAPITTAVPTTSEPPASSVARVSYLDPPPDLALRPLGVVTVPDSRSGAYSVAIGDLGVAVGTWLYGDTDGSDGIDVVGFDGSVRHVDVAAGLGAIIAYGPGDVAYTTHGDPLADFSVVAVALSGVRAATVVAAEPADVNRYMEYPPASFGHGDDGIIMRRDAGAPAIDYVDIGGQPTTLDDPAPTFFQASDELQSNDLGGRVDSSVGITWDLAAEAAPDRAGSYVGASPPAPTTEGAGVYWTHIGPNLDPNAEFGMPSMWVIARLDPDGTARWWSIPDGWEVVASDLWGTVLAHHDGDQLQLALAEFPDRSPGGDPTIVPCPTADVEETDSADLDGDGTSETVVVVHHPDRIDYVVSTCASALVVDTVSFESPNKPLIVAPFDADGDQRDELWIGGASGAGLCVRLYRLDGTVLTPLELHGCFGGLSQSLGCEAVDGVSRLVTYDYRFVGGTFIDDSTSMIVTTRVALDGRPLGERELTLPEDADAARAIVSLDCNDRPIIAT